MRANTRRDTKPELQLRSLVHRAGLRFRVDTHPNGIRYSADLLFPKAKVAVFVDGCFWHACPRHWTASATRRKFWLGKARANRRRDALATSTYREQGWVVIRVWEHDLAKFPLVAEKIAHRVRSRARAAIARQ